VGATGAPAQQVQVQSVQQQETGHGEEFTPQPKASESRGAVTVPTKP